MYTDHTPRLGPLVRRTAKLTKIWCGWQVRKLPYKEVFEHFTNNLWSHRAHGFLPLKLSHIIKNNDVKDQ